MQAEPEVGSTANSYVILAKLATGGMAEIFLARNASGAGIERYVVLKRVLRHKANDQNFIRMFLDEATLAAQLQHPNIAQVYDTGVLGDSYFFTMEYVHGETVRDILHRTYALKAQMPVSAALTIAASAAAGLHHAHERAGLDGKHLNIVHRDVTPSNLMVSFEGNVKILDFGVAKASHRSTETQSGTVKGKVSYLSPEQCRGKAIDRRSDLFSLGIVIWEMLAGDRLFKRATDYENMEAIVHETPPLVSTVRPGVPPEIEAMVAKLLAKTPDARYQNGDELLEEIERIAVRHGIALSAAGLRRFVRDLFGQRPEPWIEMQAREARPEPVTVTAEPILGGPTELDPDVDLEIDAKLASVLDLGSQPSDRQYPRAQSTPGETTTSGSQPAVPRRPTPLPFPTPPTTLETQRLPSQPALVSSPAIQVIAPRRSWLVPALIGASVVAVIGVVAFAVLGGKPPAASPPAVSAGESKVAPSVAPAPAPAPAPPPVEPAPTPPPAPPVAAIDPPHPAKPAAHPRPTPATHVEPKPAKEPQEPTAEDVTKAFLAACRAHEVGKARHLLAQLPAANKEALAATCSSSGTPLEAPAVKPPSEVKPKQDTKPKVDCEADPMSCRR